ncbi:alpha/beta hydrolase [Microbacterium sp. A93]|uniref:alpha/beta hydrolase n=1 Tax=Microbacterium sp. A93 TaxID=3450716 RepID=UPI003F422AFE
MTDIILVHGLWHQGTHMGRLAGVLRERGHRVHTPDLHRGSLAADTAYVQLIVDQCATPPLVLGHSYGGAVIIGLSGVGTLIYLAAYVPDEGESCASLGGALINEMLQRHLDGGTFMSPEAARDALYSDSDADTAAWATALLVRQASGHGRGIPQKVAWHHVPSMYVVCGMDRAVDPEVQRSMSRRCTRSVEIATDHSPYVSDSAMIANIVEGSLKELRSSLP